MKMLTPLASPTLFYANAGAQDDPAFAIMEHTRFPAGPRRDK
jgi:hypothetical protein